MGQENVLPTSVEIEEKADAVVSAIAGDFLSRISSMTTASIFQSLIDDERARVWFGRATHKNIGSFAEQTNKYSNWPSLLNVLSKEALTEAARNYCREQNIDLSDYDNYDPVQPYISIEPNHESISEFEFLKEVNL